MKNNVIFRKKSEWQKDQCLYCEKDATLESVYGISIIRCCSSEICKNRAKQLALATGYLIKK